MKTVLLLIICIMPLTVNAEHSLLNHSVKEIIKEAEALEDKRDAVNKLTELLVEDTHSVSDQIEIKLSLARMFFQLNAYPPAILNIKEAEALASENEMDLALAKANKLHGIMLYYIGEYEKSKTYYLKSLKYFQSLEDSPDNLVKQAHLHNNIALMQTASGDLAGALTSYLTAQSIYNTYGTEIDKLDVKGNIATLYIKLFQYEKAAVILKEVKAQRILKANEYGAAMASGDLGVVYKYLNELELAEQEHLKAIDYFRVNEYFYDLASQLNNIAEVYFQMDLLERSESYARQAIEISKKIQNIASLANSYQTLAQTQFAFGDVETAITNLELSNGLAIEMPDEELLTANKAIMSLIKSEQGNYKGALVDLLQSRAETRIYTNTRLNEQMALFGATQLELEIERLEQNEKLQKIEQKQENQQKNFIIIAIFFISLVAFLLYRRHLEVELTDTLEAKVKKRTTELVLLSERLVKADKIKSQFVANMSHEIRTPLTAVIGHTEGILYGDYQESELDSEVKIIHNNSLHLLGIVNDVLDMSKIEEDKLALSLSDEKIQDILTTLKGMFTKPAKRKRVLFTIDSQIENPLIVRIDSARLKQILINLCSNALKFTNQGEVKLTVEIAKNNLVFTVKDSGIGIDTEQQKNIFGSFNQADESISRHFGGTGLGLYISNQLAKMMNGTISVTSEVGKGSQFTFSMPVETAVKEIELTQQNQQATPTSSEDNSYHLDTSIVSKARSKYHGQVILAEDHQENRQFIARMLTNLGLEVLEAANGLDVLSLCESYQVNAIFMDIQMPKMDGVSALFRLKELNYPAPIYALTANAMVHEVEMYLEKGFTGHLSKPIDRAKFIAVVDEHFEKKPVNAEEPSKAVKESAGTTDSSSKNDDEISSTDLKAKFILSLVQSKASIESLMHENNLAELTKEIHKLAGAAYVFEVIEIAQCASELETELKQGKPLNEELMACLLDEINAVTS
jgi:signal transduction histidine kinase/DNA-binding response OmpR family regulator